MGYNYISSISSVNVYVGAKNYLVKFYGSARTDSGAAVGGS